MGTHHRHGAAEIYQPDAKILTFPQPNLIKILTETQQNCNNSPILLSQINFKNEFIKNLILINN
jgi:hypothetical protein